MKRRRSKKRPIFKAISSGLMSGLSEAVKLINEEDWEQARQVLEELNESYPNRLEVLGELVHVYLELNDIPRHMWACERVQRLIPPDPDLTLALSGSYLMNFYPALALKNLRFFLETWPDHEEAAEVRREIVGLESKMKEMLAEIGETGVDGLEIAAMHERVRIHLENGEYSEGRKAAEELLNRRPNFVPVLNNLSQIYFADGETEQAIATAQRVLEVEPQNYHAISNLTRFFYLSGHTASAEEYVAKLKAIKADSDDVWIKKAEAFGYLGRDEEMEEIFEEARKAGQNNNPFLLHLAAVAAMRLGHEKKARDRWKRAVEMSASFSPAAENLADLKNPVRMRHAPWPFNFNNWIREKTLKELIKLTQSSTDRGDVNEQLKRAAQRFVAEHPEINHLVRCLLDRGDATGREFALRTATMAETPELLEALSDFALGQRGPDEMRIEAANVVSAAGLIAAGQVRMWVNGEWQELLLLGIEIHGEQVGQFKPKVEKLVSKGIMALYDKRAKEAEQLFQQALNIEPDSPSILNNLALAYEMQNRSEEAERLIREIHEKHPDYLFAAVRLAQRHIDRKELNEAEEILNPLFSRKRMHFGEFSAFCDVQIQLYVAQKNLKAARSWFEMWNGIDPEHPGLDRWRVMFGKNLKEKIAGLGAIFGKEV